jgi:hypothetical protein
MRGVTQTHEGWPHGNCVQASYATLLGVPLNAIPPLDPGTCEIFGEEQGNRERAWLASIGYDLMELQAPLGGALPQALLDCMPEEPHLMSGMSKRGFGHRCVGVAGRLVWDPHPSRDGLLNVYSVGILVPL